MWASERTTTWASERTTSGHSLASLATIPLVDDSCAQARPRALAALRHAAAKRKPLEVPSVTGEDGEVDEDDKYSLFDLLCIGIGGTVGSGVFVLTGEVLPIAGPSAALSWLAAGFICMLSAFSYMEMSALVPSAGSTYAFAYHTLGELPAVVAAVCLTIEYGISAAGVARSWADKLLGLIGEPRGVMFTYYAHDPDLNGDVGIDYLGALMQAACVVVCLAGVALGKRVINTITVAKCVLIVFLVAAGFSSAESSIFSSTEVFFSKGVGGAAKGTSMLFFGFIGFDEVCCLAARSHDPRRTMPLAIAGTVLGAALLSCMAQLALSALVPAPLAINGTKGAPFIRELERDVSFEQGFAAHGWQWARWVAAVGEVALLPVVVLVAFLPQPELFAAMAQDGILPRVFARRDASGGFRAGCLLSGLFVTGVALFMPFSCIWDMTGLGVLLGFNMTNTSVIMLRVGNGGKERSRRATWLVVAFWACAATGGYTVWLTCLGPALDGVQASPIGAVAGGAALVACVPIACALSRSCQAQAARPASFSTSQLELEGTRTFHPSFRAPLVPYTPCAAIVLNFMLMAQFDGEAHSHLAGLIVLMMVPYCTLKLLQPPAAPSATLSFVGDWPS